MLSFLMRGIARKEDLDNGFSSVLSEINELKLRVTELEKKLEIAKQEVIVELSMQIEEILSGISRDSETTDLSSLLKGPLAEVYESISEEEWMDAKEITESSGLSRTYVILILQLLDSLGLVERKHLKNKVFYRKKRKSVLEEEEGKAEEEGEEGVQAD